MKLRGFKPVEENMRKDNGNYILPLRSTRKSAGYDLFSPINILIGSNEKILIWTNVKAYMQDDEVFQIYIRSSIAIKKGLVMANQVGIIDADYYSNLGNDGNIGICLHNQTDEIISISSGDKLVQGIFIKYLVADNCNSDEVRSGGIGSTGENK
jgi:dUTP pyrophosphatase